MTDERTHANGYNLTTGRSDELTWPDGDDYTWDGWNDDALTPDEYTLVLEAKLDDATRTIHRLRAELQTHRDGALVLAALVGITAGGMGGIVGALIW